MVKDGNNIFQPYLHSGMFFKDNRKTYLRKKKKFFHKHKIIDSNQKGFQSKVSATHAMLDAETTMYDDSDE